MARFLDMSYYLAARRMKRTLKFAAALLRRFNQPHPQPGTAAAGRQSLIKLSLLVVLSVASYLFFSRVVVTAVEVKGVSMAPTLKAGDLFLLNRFAYFHREPQRGELVVVRDPETGDLIVKRIIGLPCETVIMQNYVPFVNGRCLREPYLGRNTMRADMSPLSKPTVVPRGFYYVLGDNRSRSLDSRAFGPIPRESILGVITL